MRTYMPNELARWPELFAKQIVSKDMGLGFSIRRLLILDEWRVNMAEIHYNGKIYVFDDEDELEDLLEQNADVIREEHKTMEFWY